MGSPKHPLQKLTERLSKEHEEFARRSADLRRLVERGDWPGCDVHWEACCAALEGHLTHEEVWLLPVYELSGAHESFVAQTLRTEHIVLRQESARLRVAVLRRAVNLDDIQAFIDRLETHARREEPSLYRWLEQHAMSACAVANDIVHSGSHASND